MTSSCCCVSLSIVWVNYDFFANLRKFRNSANKMELKKFKRGVKWIMSEWQRVLADVSFPKTQRVILNEVKNLNALSGCSQILRDAQDDTLGRGELWKWLFHHHLFQHLGHAMVAFLIRMQTIGEEVSDDASVRLDKFRSHIDISRFIGFEAGLQE